MLDVLGIFRRLQDSESVTSLKKITTFNLPKNVHTFTDTSFEEQK